MLRTLFALLAALAAVACVPLEARPLVEMAVVDRDTGQWLDPVRHAGQHWIAGTPGHRYSVRLTNTTGRRVLVVLSVDGVNAVTGQTALPEQTGYVLGPWQSSEIQGWRKSLDEVAQFVFTDLPGSYAARTGRPDNVGVIGVAVFEEARRWHDESPAPIARGPIARGPIAREPHRSRPIPREPMGREDGARSERNAAKSASPAAESRSADADMAAQSIGTGHGAHEWSQASRTDFERASRAPSQISELRYDDHDALVARGCCAPIRDIAGAIARMPSPRDSSPTHPATTDVALADRIRRRAGRIDRPVGYRPRSASRSAPADPMPARCAGKDDSVQALLEVAHFALCAFALPSIAFLKATGEVFGIALRHIDVVVRQIAPLGMHLTLQLVPLARNHVFVHLIHPHSLARLIDVARE
jgi:hypothetical protein